MKITYIQHSAFLIETSSVSVLFDYYRGTVPNVSPSVPLYFFASHAHPDHFSKKTYPAADDLGKAGVTDIRFVLSDDIPESKVPDSWKSKTMFLAPHSDVRDGLLHIETLQSNDAGVAFLLEVPDGDSGIRTVYHAGDLNSWNWDGDEEDLALCAAHRKELERIKGRHFDVTFFPVDPRLNERFHEGIDDFMHCCDTDHIFPMHFWDDYDVCNRLKSLPSSAAYAEKVEVISKEGETFVI